MAIRFSMLKFATLALCVAGLSAPPIYGQRLQTASLGERMEIDARSALDGRPAPFGKNGVTAPHQAPGPLYADGKGLTIYGNVIYARSWGENDQVLGFKSYNYNGDVGLSAEQLINDMYLFANGSGSFYDGKFHFVSKGYSEYLYGEFTYPGWEMIKNEISLTKFQKLVATDCDYDPVTGLTYGCYWNPDIQNYEFAWVDYETEEHHTIAPMEIYSAIAINSKGEVFGIKESDGGLYRIDKTTGEQRLVGLTGIKPVYLQSATFDRSNDVMYWAVRQEGSVAYLATVNTDTGALKRLAYFPDNEQIACLYVPFLPEAKAPAPAQEMAVEGSGASLDLTFSFKMPTITVDSAAIGNRHMKYSVGHNAREIASGSALAGKTVSIPVTAAPGYNSFTVTVANDTGESECRELRSWCGPDVPGKVENLTLTIDNANSNTVDLTWDIADLGKHKGRIGKENMRFEVVRMPDSVVVAKDLTTTTFSESLGYDNPGVYSYVVTASANGVKGDPALSSSRKATGVFSVPYSESFGNKTAFEFFGVYDANGDNKKWFWNETLEMAEYLSNYINAADDWLLTPEIKFKKGVIYEVSYDIQANNKNYPEWMGIKVGKGDDYASYVEVKPVTIVDNYSMERQSALFSVDSDDDYHIAFICQSTANGRALLFDNLKVDVGPDPASPARVTDLSMTADAAGKLVATLNFTAPKLRADGKTTLLAIDAVEIYRNSDGKVGEIKNPTPGAALEYVDNSPATGTNIYTIVAVNNAGNGESARVQGYVGQDIPYEPENIKATDNGDHITLTWTAPSGNVGRNRLPVIPEELTYNVYNSSKSLIAEGVGALTFDTDGSENSGSQKMVNFHVTAVTGAGESRMGDSEYLVVGRPYGLPFRESFAGGNDAATFWWTDGYNVFQPSKEQSYDDDGGCIRWKANKWDKTSWFNSGKLYLKGAKKPIATFAYYATPGVDFKLHVFISPNGVDRELGVIDFNTLDGEIGWRTVTYDLAPYTECDYAFFKLYVDNQATDLIVYVDQIAVRDTEGCDMAATKITAPVSIYPGQSLPVRVDVENWGAVAPAFDVDLYVDGVVAASRRCEPVAPGESDVVVLDYTQPFNKSRSVEMLAKVRLDGDSNIDDDTTPTASVEVLPSTLPKVNDLVASKVDTGVELTWSAPEVESKRVVESFEDYVHKDQSFGLWTTIDNELGQVYSVTTMDIGFYNVPLAYAVFNSIAAGVADDDWEFYAAHDGTTSLVAIASQPSTIYGAECNDDWLISPRLAPFGSEREVSFWAKSAKGDKYGLEDFEVLYTTGFGNDLTGYVEVARHQAPQDWTNYRFEIPADALHFAVRYRGNDSFVFMLDDFEFETGEYKIAGYDIYRDGVKIAAVDAGVSAFSAPFESNDAIYNVVVRYDNGDSYFSNDAIVGATTLLPGVTDGLPSAPFDIYGVDGRCVRRGAASFDGVAPGVYIVGNRKVVIM